MYFPPKFDEIQGLQCTVLHSVAMKMSGKQHLGDVTINEEVTSYEKGNRTMPRKDSCLVMTPMEHKNGIKVEYNRLEVRMSR